MFRESHISGQHNGGTARRGQEDPGLREGGSAAPGRTVGDDL